MHAAVSPTPGSRFAERYEIVRLLGAGGMGSVYEARDLQLRRRIAIKVPHALGDPSRRQRFMREARAAARLWHPNICPIFDVGEFQGRLYLAMAYLQGRPLTALLANNEPLDTVIAVRIIRTLAEALQSAHDAGVLHLDLKPANVMLGRHDNPILMDFGLARLTADHGDSLTLDAGFAGTPAYMAPEQIGSGPLSAATDIYGLGVIFYELLTGHPPFQGSLGAVLAQAQTYLPAPPSRTTPDVPRPLEDICMRALAKDPLDRYASMADMADALDIVTGSRPPPTSRQRVSDRDRLSAALTQHRAWEALYYAKRLLQMNLHDVEAYKALAQVAQDPADLTYVDSSSKRRMSNAFTRSMDVKTLVDFVREAGLVERDEGDLICRYNELGDNMFLILRGEVGVFLPHAEDGTLDCSREPDFRFGAGHIVGELAFALKRRRTATIRALERTSLLAFSYERLRHLTAQGVLGTTLSASVDAYLRSRVLKFVFDSAPYLSRAVKELAALIEPWHLVGERASILNIDHQRHPLLTKDTLPQLANHRGLVLLAGGSVRCEQLDERELHERELPVLFAHFEDRFAYTHVGYRLNQPITLVLIDQDAFQELDHLSPGVLHDVVTQVRLTTAQQFTYDVFLSYTQHDVRLASDWRSALEQAGLKVYMDAQRAPARFIARVRAALLDSLILMSLLTENTSARRLRDSWIRRELEFRARAYEQTANIVPLNLGGGQPGRFADGYSPIEAFGRKEEAIHEVVSMVQALRLGQLPSPHSVRPCTGDL